jgi:ligand-binding sensor domain-containing protein
MLKKWLWRAGLAVIPVIVLGYVGFALWQARRAEHESAKRIASEGKIAFRSLRLGRTPPAGFEWISAPAVFNDAREYRGHVYVSGPMGLFDYDAGGALVARFRSGLELPGAPLVALAAGAAADASEPELFIATAGEGLLAFDGRSFRQIVADDATYRTLTAVLPLGTGRILFGTPKKGVLVYDGRTITPFHRALSDLSVTALAGDEASLWVGTLGGGVLHWHSGQVDRFSEAEGLPDPQVLSIALAGDTAYVGTPLGVAEFRGGWFTRSLAAGSFARALLVRGDRLVIGTFDEGIVEAPLAASPPRAARPPCGDGCEGPSHIERLVEMNGAVYAVAEDGLYAGSQPEGEPKRVLEREGAVLAGRNIAALGLDNSGRLWVGYFDRGLDIVEPGWERARHMEDEHLFCVNRIVFDPHPAPFMAAVATANGLVLFDAAARQRRVLGRAQGLIADHVTDVALDSGRLVVATPAGLTFIDEGGARSMYAFHGLVNNHVYALASSGSHLLAGTLGGMSVLEGGVVRASYTTVNSGLRHNWITAITAVGGGWFVGTYGGGVLRLDAGGQWEPFAGVTGAFEVNPGAMLATERHVYAGTLGRGLYVYDRASGRWSTVTAGLPSKNVTALAAGGGYLYIGTDNGLVRVPEETLR